MIRAARRLFRCTGQLGKRDDRYIQFFGHDLEVPGNVTDLLHAALGALGTLHQLQVVDDNEPDFSFLGSWLIVRIFALISGTEIPEESSM